MKFVKPRAEDKRISNTNADSIKTKTGPDLQKSDIFYKRDIKYSRGQVNMYCKNCKDGAFELLENKKQTGRCCRCGDKFANN